MKTYEGVEVQLRTFSISGLDGTRGQRAVYQVRRLSGDTGRSRFSGVTNVLQVMGK